MSLGAKLTLWVLVPLLVVLIVYAIVTLKREQEVHQREVLEEAERIANTLAISVTESLRRQTPQDLQSIVERSALTPDRFGLAVYDSLGRPLMTWGLAAKVGAIGRQELTALSSVPRGIGLAEEERGVPVRSHLVALTANGELLGGLRVAVSLQEIQQTLTRERDYFLSMLAVVTVVLVVLISVTIRRTMSVPLGRLMERVADLGRGQRPEDVVVTGKDEVARLAQEFNGLARSLYEARQRLVRESEYAQNVIQSITDGIIGIDASYRVRTWNRAMADRYGIPESEVMGRDLFEAFPLLAQEGLRKEVDGLLKGEFREFTIRYFEHETLRRGRVVLNIRGSALPGENDAIAGAVLAIEDVTEHHYAEYQFPAVIYPFYFENIGSRLVRM